MSRLHPIGSKEENASIYDQSYFDKKCDSKVNQYAQPTCGSDYNSAGKERLKVFASSLQKLKYLHPRAVSFLDVGAAFGHMVYLARLQDLQADGIELSEYAISKARELYQINLFKSTLEDFSTSQKYDLIHLSHVFEHFIDPLSELFHFKRLLSPNGLIYIEVPFQFNFVERFRSYLSRKTVPMTLHSLHHPYFYQPASLRKIFLDNGFEVKYLSVFDPMRYDVATFSGKIKCQLWKFLSLFGVGNYIEIIVSKSNS